MAAPDGFAESGIRSKGARCHQRSPQRADSRHARARSTGRTRTHLSPTSSLVASNSGWRLRALVAKPLALLMDEPPSNLDDELKDEICAQLLDLQAQLGFTLVYVTHSKEEMRKIGSRTILLRSGREVAA